MKYIYLLENNIEKKFLKKIKEKIKENKNYLIMSKELKIKIIDASDGAVIYNSLEEKKWWEFWK